MKKRIMRNEILQISLARKLLMVMKITFILLLVGLMQVSASTYSQNTKLTLNLKNVKIAELFEEIEKNSEFRFFYDSSEIDLSKKVTVDMKKSKIEQILNVAFLETGLSYELIDRHIIVKNTRSNTTFGEISEAQQKSITGTVTDETGQALPGVTVVIKGTIRGTVTNMDGNYSISNIPENATLVFSFIGMITQEIIIGTQTAINVTMQVDAIGIEEVVAIGYGTQKRATVTGSISAIHGEELMQSPTINFTNTLSGRLPGLIAVQRTGEPGNDGTILRIRGSNTLNNNSPLVVVDGIANRSMSHLNPADIENVTILKDASAAIYGAQAANGVILITTKRGKIGTPEVRVNINQGVNSFTRVPEMANAPQYMQMLNEIDFYRAREPRYSDEDIQHYIEGDDPWRYPDTDWFAEVFKKYAPQTNGNVSLSGGTEKMQYFVSIGGKYQDGQYKNSATNFSQFDFRTNIDGQVSKNLHVAFDVSGRQVNRNYPTQTASRIFWATIQSKPSMPAFWPNGLPGPDIAEGLNPVVMATDATGYDKTKAYVLETNLKLDLNIPWIKGLTLSGTFSVDKSFDNRKVWRTPWYLYTWDYESYDENGEPLLVKGKRGYSEPSLTQRMRESQKITMNALLNYETKIGDNQSLNILVGSERSESKNEFMQAFRRYYLSREIDQLYAGGDAEKDNNGSGGFSARMNYFGRVNYRLFDKYLAEFVWRYDGSDIFPKETRFGFFPGVSLGWRISEEDFWKENISFLENFKIRSSWGQTGNDRVARYQYLSSYQFSSRTYVFGDDEENKLLSEALVGNPNITWEVATQFNIGIDGQILNNRLYFEADYFKNTRTEILWRRNASVPSSAGLRLSDENIGEVDNRGFELLLRYNDTFGEFKFGASINGAYQKNKIVFWDETPGVPEYQITTGKPMPSNPKNPDGDLYYQAIGIFKDEAQVNSIPHWAGAVPGDIIFEDVNNDGVIDGLDRVRDERNNMPRFTGGVSFNLGYKNLDLAFLIQGAAGAVSYIDVESGEIGNYLKEFADNRWTPTNTDADYPRTYNRNEEYWARQRNTFWLRSTDYVRLKNLELGYSLPNQMAKKIGFKDMRVYLNGMNLLTLDKHKVYDPEQDSVDGKVYPLNKTYNIGVTLTF